MSLLYHNPFEISQIDAVFFLTDTRISVGEKYQSKYNTFRRKKFSKSQLYLCGKSASSLKCFHRMFDENHKPMFSAQRSGLNKRQTNIKSNWNQPRKTYKSQCASHKVYRNFELKNPDKICNILLPLNKWKGEFLVLLIMICVKLSFFLFGGFWASFWSNSIKIL